MHESPSVVVTEICSKYKCVKNEYQIIVTVLSVCVRSFAPLRRNELLPVFGSVVSWGKRLIVKSKTTDVYWQITENLLIIILWTEFCIIYSDSIHWLHIFICVVSRGVEFKHESSGWWLDAGISESSVQLSPALHSVPASLWTLRTIPPATPSALTQRHGQ